MSAARRRLDEAHAAALARRAAMLAQVAEIKQRWAPARLKSEAAGIAQLHGRDLRDGTLAHIKANPVAVGAAALAVVGWVLRKPILARSPARVQALYDWAAGRLPAGGTAGAADDAGGDSADAAAAERTD
jgi:hypothetical protein